ncbi:MAG: hypothetical protein ACREVJ_00085 [Gammaproteobacteria bacterium]
MSVGSIAGAETVNTRIGKLSFENGYPSKESVTKLYDENTNKVKTAEKLEL